MNEIETEKETEPIEFLLRKDPEKDNNHRSYENPLCLCGGVLTAYVVTTYIFHAQISMECSDCNINTHIEAPMRKPYYGRKDEER